MKEVEKPRIQEVENTGVRVPKNILWPNALICGALSIRDMTSKPQYLVFMSLAHYYMRIWL
jgi:hypothetical protein